MRYIFILFILITMTNIANSDQSSGSIYHLNPNEILNLKKKAEIDSKASYRLYEYYTLSEYNEDRKSTRLNSSHQIISYAVFCLKKKKTELPHTSHTTTE